MVILYSFWNYTVYVGKEVCSKQINQVLDRV